MDTKTVENKSSLRLKFAAFYILSIALISFIIFYLVPNNSALNPVVTASPLASANDNLQDDEILGKIEILNKEYQTLKMLDRDFADGKAGSQNKDLVGMYIGNITNAENAINNTLDSIARAARSSNSAQSLKLQTFIESYRLTLADRSAMNAYKTAMLSSGNATTNQKAILQLQTDLTARNSQISLLQNELQMLRIADSKKSAVATPANQQKITDLTATISAQEKKIAGLMADIAALEKEKNNFETASRKGNDNSAGLRSQNASLEQRITQLSADLKLAQADCNITRADASQIISNSKQRKNLLSEALSILNGLSLSTDASIKNKVAEKVSYLNKVAATMHD